MILVKRLFRLLVPVYIFFSITIPVFAGGKDEGVVPDKINTEGLVGFTLFLVNLFNDQRFAFAIVVTLLMALVGITIAYLTDLILKAFGLQVSKIAHHE